MNCRFAAVLLALVLLAACVRAPENKEAVKQGVLDHLAKNSGLDMASMNVEVTNVSFQGDQANATISFRPKASPDQGMTMNYTLKRQGNKWLVEKKADSGGHSGGMTQPAPKSGSDLPPGHPPLPSKPESSK